MGFLLSKEGYQIDPSITEAISKYPVSTSCTKLRSFIGLVNQLSSSTKAVAILLALLLSTKNEFVWSPSHNTAFLAAKESLTTLPVLSFFDIIKPTRLSTDASRQGLGYILRQQHGNNWIPITISSQVSLCNYRVRVTCSCMGHQEIQGLQDFSVITDHNPLVPILNSRRLDEIENPRLQCLKSRLMGYNFTTRWVKGKGNSGPDALSCSPVFDPQWDASLAEYDHPNYPEPSITETRQMLEHCGVSLS